MAAVDISISDIKIAGLSLSQEQRSRLGRGTKSQGKNATDIGNLVLLGGVSNGVANRQCWYQDNFSENWKELTSLPENYVKYPYHFGACVVDNGLVIAGDGSRCWGPSAMANAWFYTMKSNTWHQLPSMR